MNLQAHRFARLATSTLVTLAALSPLTSKAETIVMKSGVIEEVYVEGTQRPAPRKNVAWVKMSGSWGTSSCLGDWAWFSSEQDAKLLAAALTGRSAGSAARGYVDADLPRLDGYCQLVILSV